jgi:hypothetical protein
MLYSRFWAMSVGHSEQGAVLSPHSEFSLGQKPELHNLVEDPINAVTGKTP